MISQAQDKCVFPAWRGRLQDRPCSSFYLCDPRVPLYVVTWLFCNPLTVLYYTARRTTVASKHLLKNILKNHTSVHPSCASWAAYSIFTQLQHPTPTT